MNHHGSWERDNLETNYIKKPTLQPLQWYNLNILQGILLNKLSNANQGPPTKPQAGNDHYDHCRADSFSMTLDQKIDAHFRWIQTQSGHCYRSCCCCQTHQKSNGINHQVQARDSHSHQSQSWTGVDHHRYHQNLVQDLTVEGDDQAEG